MKAAVNRFSYRSTAADYKSAIPNESGGYCFRCQNLATNRMNPNLTNRCHYLCRCRDFLPAFFETREFVIFRSVLNLPRSAADFRVRSALSLAADFRLTADFADNFPNRPNATDNYCRNPKHHNQTRNRKANANANRMERNNMPRYTDYKPTNQNCR